jgi:peptide deformylase
MCSYPVLKYPHKNLRIKAEKVTEFNQKLQEIVDKMLVTMYEHKGIGLAATQVNIHQQIVTMDISEEGNEPRVFINPSLTIVDSELVEYKEGCLSLPDIYDMVARPKAVEVTYFDIKGNQHKELAEGLFAVCIQHEVDHLNGKLFIDDLSALKKNRIKQKMKKYHQNLQK